MTENPIVERSFGFALRVLKLCRYLAEEHKEFTLSRELLTAGTNIGKHVVSAVSGDSSESFTRSMAQALTRADETEYWLKLIRFAEYITEREFDSIEADRKVIAKMLTKIVKTSRGDRSCGEDVLEMAAKEDGRNINRNDRVDTSVDPQSAR